MTGDTRQRTTRGAPHVRDGLDVRGAMLALAVHGLLLIALAAGVRWRHENPPTFSAELWASLPQLAAPRPVEPEPTPPAPTPTPTPPPEPAARQAPPPPTEAEIALEKAEKEKERQRREEERLAREKARAEKIERERLAEAERQKKAEAELARQEKVRKEAEARLEAQRQENLQRMMGQAGATGGPNARGTAAQDAGPSASYAGKLVGHIRPNIVWTEPFPPSRGAEVEVRASPTGRVLARRIVRSSGDTSWDEAVLRAIDRSGNLPPDRDGRVPASMIIVFTPE